MSETTCSTDCPFAGSATPTWRAPVGQVRAIAPSGGAEEVDETKRNVLKLLAIAGVIGAAGGGLVGGALQYLQPPSVGLKSYPTTQLLDTNGKPLTIAQVNSQYSISTSTVLTFTYPLVDEPNFLLNLSGNSQGITKVPYGIGDNEDGSGLIVAYSAICQHLGCVAPLIRYYPPGTCPGKTFTTAQGILDFFIHCSCHGSTYNAADQAHNLTGPAILPLPQVILKVIDGTIWATGMTPSSPVVKGHTSTLLGDTGVGTTTSLTNLGQGPTACTFPI